MSWFGVLLRMNPKTILMSFIIYMRTRRMNFSDNSHELADGGKFNSKHE